MEDQIGSLTAGMRADIVLTDAALRPEAIYRDGVRVA
jgi:cytosine/adenosine deaminase-related metal-dependent hydrolase